MKIVLFGACGKMGCEVAKLAAEEIVFGIDPAPAAMPFPVFGELSAAGETNADVAIDFSAPCGLEERLAFCRERKLPLVFGVTGCSLEDEAAIKKTAEAVPILKSSNFSEGIFVLNELVFRAAALLKNSDAEIVERHRREKKDAPSGTARLLSKSIERASGHPHVPIHSVRSGTLAGMHEVMFASEGEALFLSHTAFGPSVFARGALRAARWIVGKPCGLYDEGDLFRCGSTSAGL